MGEIQVVLDVSNRELLRIISVLPETFPHADVVKIAARDDDHLDAQLDQLGLFLAALMSVPGELVVTLALVPLRYSTKLQGFSRDELTVATMTNMQAPVAPAPQTAAPTPAAEPVAHQGPDLRFYQQLAPKSDAALVMDWGGAILQKPAILRCLTALAMH